MKIVGCDLHTRYQQIAMLDTETGEVIERRLEHANGEARAFYAGLQGPVRVGIEATGHTRWFEPGAPPLSSFLWTTGWDRSQLHLHDPDELCYFGVPRSVRPMGSSSASSILSCTVTRVA